MFFLEFDDYAEIVDDDPDYAHPMAGRFAISMAENFADRFRRVLYVNNVDTE